MLATRGDREQAELRLSQMGLLDVRGQKVGTLSGGERRKLDVARSMCNTPQMLLLDEPFAGLDPLSLQDVVRRLQALCDSGVSLLITDHLFPAALAICPRVLYMEGGQITGESTREEIRKHPWMESSLNAGMVFATICKADT